MNEASNPASRYIKYNRFLQQCLWPITFNKTCIWKVNKLACRIAGIILAMVQTEHVLEHDFVQVLPFIWSLQRNYLNGCIHQGLWLWWYGLSAHWLVCYAMCLWYILSIGLFSFNIQDVYRLFFFNISYTTIKKFFELTYGYRRGWGSGVRGVGQSRAFITI